MVGMVGNFLRHSSTQSFVIALENTGEMKKDSCDYNYNYNYSYNCDSTTIRLRSDYDPTTTPASIQREQKMNMSIFRRR